MGKSRIKLDLVENGKDSLRHAVEHFTDNSKPTDLKYAVLHVFHAVELFLKAALSKSHSSLIFQKPEDAKNLSARTVDFQTLLRRLKAVDAELSEDDCKHLDTLRQERNKIEHYQVDLDKQEVQNWIGQAMRILNEFVEVELEFKFEDVLDRDTYQVLAESIYTFEQQLARAEEALPQWGPNESLEHELITCPECGQDTIPDDDPEFEDNRVRCRFCNSEFFATGCNSCGGTILMNEPLTRENDPGRCSACWEHLLAGD